MKERKEGRKEASKQGRKERKKDRKTPFMNKAEKEKEVIRLTKKGEASF